MSNIELSIPVGVTAAQIRQANLSIDKETAQKDAVVLHHIIACVQKAVAIRPDYFPDDEDDIIVGLLHTAFGFWPKDKEASQRVSDWVSEKLMIAEELKGEDDLFRN